jgi:hypothetical protein
MANEHEKTIQDKSSIENNLTNGVRKLYIHKQKNKVRLLSYNIYNDQHKRQWTLKTLKVLIM